MKIALFFVPSFILIDENLLVIIYVNKYQHKDENRFDFYAGIQDEVLFLLIEKRNIGEIRFL